MSIKVSMDTMVLSFLYKRLPAGVTNPGQDVDNMHLRCKYLIQVIDEAEHEVVIPAIVAAEFLSGVEEARQTKFLERFASLYHIVPFDVRAAKLAAHLWDINRPTPVEGPITRSVLKADTLIIASAKIGGASIFYSNDKGCRSLAKQAGMTACDLPESSAFLFGATDDKITNPEPQVDVKHSHNRPRHQGLE